MIDPQRLHDVFADALDRPAAGRGAFLDAACGGDADLRAAADALLVAYDGAGRFLSDPVVAVDPAEPLRRVGPYRLLRVIGQGGHGTVYLAEQDEPLRRTVAVKVIRAGRDTAQTVARFHLERQALARMDHPNIARVFDAGATADGRPYVVMEWVDGRPITDYCRDGKLPIADRLAIFRDVCAAVGHAHQKGIIHRDLKPTNVLVAVVDGRPVPKVIDFGIAKAVDPADGDLGLTRHEQLLGTPQYMSPEQVGDDPGDVDTRADVYGLGAVLYELLTDRPPFDAATLRSAAAAEVRRVLTEVEPPRPSLQRRVARELDWVVGRAIEKDRTRRYPTAEALSADVLRFLSDEPVEAGPPTARYRVGKFVRRHRRLVATVVVVALSVAAGTTAATVGLVRARAARDRAVVAERRANDQQRLAEANAARVFSAQTFVYQLIVPPVGEKPVLPEPVLDLLARRAHDGLLAEHPEVLATLHLALGMAYQRVSRAAPAVVQYRAYLALQPDPLPDSINNASAMHNLGAALLSANDYAGSDPLFRRALEMYRRLHGGRDDIDDAAMLEHLGTTTENLDEAERLLRAAVALYRAHDHPPGERLGGALGVLAQVRKFQGHPDESDALWAEANPLLGRKPATAPVTTRP